MTMTEPAQPRHLQNLTVPFIAVISGILWWVEGPWWQVGLILLFMELWDLGWHSSAHHQSLWIAHPFVRTVGFVGAVLVALFAF